MAGAKKTHMDSEVRGQKSEAVRCSAVSNLAPGSYTSRNEGSSGYMYENTRG